MYYSDIKTNVVTQKPKRKKQLRQVAIWRGNLNQVKSYGKLLSENLNEKKNDAKIHFLSQLPPVVFFFSKE